MFCQPTHAHMQEWVSLIETHQNCTRVLTHDWIFLKIFLPDLMTSCFVIFISFSDSFFTFSFKLSFSSQLSFLYCSLAALLKAAGLSLSFDFPSIKGKRHKWKLYHMYYRLLLVHVAGYYLPSYKLIEVHVYCRSLLARGILHTNLQCLRSDADNAANRYSSLVS